jgi:hypothetical protein
MPNCEAFRKVWVTAGSGNSEVQTGYPVRCINCGATVPSVEILIVVAVVAVVLFLVIGVVQLASRPPLDRSRWENAEPRAERIDSGPR